MWAVWVYLFLPLFSVVMWGLGLRTFYTHVFRDAAIPELCALLTKLVITIAIIFLSLRGWELYNLYFFGRRNRRKQTEVLTMDNVGQRYGLTISEISELQEQKEIVWDRLYEEMVARKDDH